MDHLAILNPKLGLLEKIISGEKPIESRWSKDRRTPYKKVSVGDYVYFKNSGDKVRVRAEVKDVKYFSGLTDQRIRELLREYGDKICVDVSYADELKGRKYGSLIFLKEVEEIEPFKVKRQYGAAWLSVTDINQLILPS